MIDDANTKRYLCKYKLPTMVLMMKDEKIELDATNILSVEYLCDYEFNIRAILKVVLRLDIRKRLWILKNKRDIVCKFELNKIGMDVDTEMFNTSPELVWNCEFSIYLNDDDESVDVQAMEARLEQNQSEDFQLNDLESENYYESQNIVPLYLFNRELLDASNKVYNEVYTENTIQQFIGRLLTATKHKKVLMSKAENDEVYKELIMPAHPAYKALIYMDQYYGIYKKGATIFYDIDTLYILNSAGDKVTAKREGEWVETTFVVTSIENTVPGNGMIRKEGEKVNYVALSDADISTQKFTETNNEHIGSEAKVVITDDTAINIEDADQSYINQRNETIVYNTKSDNKYNADIMKARMEENEVIFYINGENWDISAFSPNKIFQLVFDETLKQEKYGKFKYRIAYAYHFFLIESEGYMSPSSRIALKKCST